MRLLRYSEGGELSIHSFDDGAVPPYAILSHTWGADREEVTFADLEKGYGRTKPGYQKIVFCGKQAQRDGLQHFWIDTCCINKDNMTELASAIRSMFRWYRNAARCYVYLSDVPRTAICSGDLAESIDFRQSRWFTRGWTLQELLAPSAVDFFSKEGDKLGSKLSLLTVLHEITGIPEPALQGTPLSDFIVNERVSWSENRTTTLPADLAYSLMGILGVSLSPINDETLVEAMKRVTDEVEKQNKCIQDIRQTDPRDDKKRIEDTKGGLLADSYRWVLNNTTFQQWRKNLHNQLLWVKGDPGKGKTMLLCGIINELHSSIPRTTLLSYFFCQATDSRINNATAVLRGLLYMLIVQQPLLVAHVRKKYDYAGKALFEDANAWFALKEIFKKLLQDPSLGTIYLIVDALDECVTDFPRLLAFIVDTPALSARTKWLLSSRNEVHIEKELRSIKAEARLSLELKQNAKQVSCAVEAFIDHKLSMLNSLSDENLRDRVRYMLREKADNTFLWVALIIKELEKPESWNPLEVVKEAPAGLYELYDLMMSRIQQLKKSNSEICRLLLSITSVAYRPLCLAEIGSMCGLLGQISMVETSARTLVAMCGSFLTIRDDRIFLVHQSAKDYLSDKMQDKTLLSQPKAHYSMYTQSLKIMSDTLKRDMYGLIAPGHPVVEIEVPVQDLLARTRYSCVYWVDHLRDSNPLSSAVYIESLQDKGTVDTFLKEKYLYWLEALSLCRSMPEGVLSVAKLQSLVQGARGSSSLRALVNDAYQFIMYHKGVIANYPLQAYASALLFSPTASLVRKLFKHEEPEGIIIKLAISDGWDACLQTLDDHSSDVRSVAFSHDSAQLASASYDKTVKIWDISSGVCLQTLEGHRSNIWLVAFSHDSAQVASASADKTVKIWDTSSGACLQTLKGHSSNVWSVAFSHDSAQVASASADITVKIWDASNGTCLQTLEGHSDWVMSVAFSYDSVQLASASADNTVKIWDISSGACLRTLKGYSDWVMSVVYLYDSAQLASASYDSTVKIWDTSSGACLQTFNTKKSLTNLSFNTMDSCLYTEIGAIAIRSSEVSSIGDIAESEDLYAGISLSLDATWINHAGNNILWVPPEYRPSCSSVRGSIIGIGVRSGKVWSCRIGF